MVQEVKDICVTEGVSKDLKIPKTKRKLEQWIHIVKFLFDNKILFTVLCQLIANI